MLFVFDFIMLWLLAIPIFNKESSSNRESQRQTRPSLGSFSSHSNSSSNGASLALPSLSQFKGLSSTKKEKNTFLYLDITQNHLNNQGSEMITIQG